MSRVQVTFPTVLRRLRVAEVHDVSPLVRRVVLTGEQLDAHRRDGVEIPPFRSLGFDDDIRLYLPAPGEREPVLPVMRGLVLETPRHPRPISRSVTVRRFDPATGRVTVEVVRHEVGVLTGWARTVRVGDPVWITGPHRSGLAPDPALGIIGFGDATALPALARWCEEMPGSARGDLYIAAPPEARAGIDPPSGVRVHWADTEDALERQVRSHRRDGTPVFAWGAAEGRLVRRLRSVLRHEHGVAADHVDAVGYWVRRTAGDRGPSVGQRLHDMADILPPIALRVAVTLGIPQLVDAGTASGAALAAATGTDPDALVRFLDYLVLLDVLVARSAIGVGHRYTLGAIGTELLEHALASSVLDLGGATARVELSLLSLLESLRTGHASPAVTTGRLLRDDLARRPDLAGGLDTSAGWHNGWLADDVVRLVSASARRVRVIGYGAAPVRDALRRRGVEPADAPASSGGLDAVVALHVLRTLTDAEVRTWLAEQRAALAPDGRLVLVERPNPRPVSDERTAQEDLEALCCYGAALRDLPAITDLAARAGFRAEAVSHVGWTTQAIVLRTAARPAAPPLAVRGR